MILTVTNLKGGTGKTTLSVALAEAAALRGSALLVDADPQGSASSWAEEAEGTGEPLRAQVLSLPTQQLARRLDPLSGSYGVVVIDTPPQRVEIISAALELADFALYPVRPAPADVARLWTALEMAPRGVRTRVVLCQVRAGTLSLEAAREALRHSVDLAPVIFPLREAIAADYGRRPGPLLAGLGGALLTYLNRTRR